MVYLRGNPVVQRREALDQSRLRRMDNKIENK
jgi:hypothetical protein